MKTMTIIDRKLDFLLKWKEKEENLDEDLKRDLNCQISAWSNLKNEMEFELLTPVEKQVKRIGYLASCRKTNANCNGKLKSINIYDIINISLPYIRALNHSGKLSLIEELCLRELDFIDIDLTGDTNSHVELVEIEIAFKPYFEIIAPFKMDMFKECYERIENLYTELKKLDSE